MAKFVYKMQSILNIKYKLEEQAKTEYGIANQKLREEEQLLQDLLLRRAKYEQLAEKLMTGTIDIVKIKENRRAIDAMKKLVRDQMLKVHVAEKNLKVAREKLNNVMVERKAHEKLKEKAFEEFKQELAAEESKEIDQLVSYTYHDKEES